MRHLYGTGVGGLLVDALHQLMADTALVSVAGRWGRITEVDLDAGTRAGREFETARRRPRKGNVFFRIFDSIHAVHQPMRNSTEGVPGSHD